MPYRYERALVLVSAAVTLVSCAALGPPPAPGSRPPPAVSNSRLHQTVPQEAAAPLPAPEPPPSTPAPIPEPQPEISAAPAAAAALIRDAAAFGELPPVQQQDRLKAAAAAYRRQGSPDALLRLALYSALVGPQETADDGVRADLAAYIERARSGREEDAQLLPLARYTAGLLDQRDELVAAKAALQRKLDELKAIEERLDKHDQPEGIRIAP